jgi:glucokinase
MSILGIDLGGSKLATALFSESGTLLTKESVSLGRRKGSEVGALIDEQVLNQLVYRYLESVAIGPELFGPRI